VQTRRRGRFVVCRWLGFCSDSSLVWFFIYDCFRGKQNLYKKNNTTNTQAYDATALAAKYNGPPLNILIDQVSVGDGSLYLFTPRIRVRRTSFTRKSSFCPKTLLPPVPQTACRFDGSEVFNC
jgi:hypothetical protein